MNILKKILIQKGILYLNKQQIENWISNGQIVNLEFALQIGNFKIRQQVLAALGELKSETSTELIVKSIDDKVKIVSLAAIAALAALEQIGSNSEAKKVINKKIEYWKEKDRIEKERRKNFTHRTNSDIPSWERTSKETYENMKEMIKKPMIGGKWF